MNIECFVSENHMCNLGERLFNEIFDLDAMAELADDKFTREAVYMLSQYLCGNTNGPFKAINRLADYEQIYVYEIWISIIKSTDELKILFKAILRHCIE
ncbi:hypothetical protein OO184_04150 [Photorhabdus sp. APURE]|uniref:hypothetical protein n=1 Tax=Photorhabdus aballayi TaxID=2991723 RepID=UPI00223DD0A7|nr:hypothetical protein [Photorhabdus aballayi]MCW7547157.1 hypothetical protein [Photorhabdus aballayi]